MCLKRGLNGLEEKALADTRRAVYGTERIARAHQIGYRLRLTCVQLRVILPDVGYSPMLQLLLCFLGIDYRLNQLPLHLKRLESGVAFPWCVFAYVFDLLQQAMCFLGSYFILEV